MDGSWKPTLAKNQKPLYLALVRALSDDIESGRLAKGSRLPAQRELADELKIAIGTVTRAYDEAEKRGLLFGDGRRGTFVGELPKARSFLSSLSKVATMGIDLSKNHPAPGLDPELSAALYQIAKSTDNRLLLQYPPPAGLTSHRTAGAKWLTSLGLAVDAERVFISGGAQHGFMAVFAAEARAGDIIVAEEYTYPGVKAVADMLGLQQIGVAIDQEGIIPEALESICRHKEIRLLYCNPSLQNPTNAIMSLNRRRQIAALAEKYNFCVIEDEILSPLLEDRPGFIADIIPNRCYFVISSSKALAAGLRVGFIAAPAQSIQKITDSLQGTSLGQPPLMAEIFTRWLEDGTLAKTIARRKQEIAWGQKMSSEILQGFEINSHPSSYHIWLQLPEPWTSLNFTDEAQMRGVGVAPAEIFAMNPKSKKNAVRLSIGSAPNRELLKNGLGIIADILSGRKRQDIVTV